MATTTANYNLIKPTMAESADIRTINGNMDTVDDIMHASQISLAPAYDSTETYNTGDVVMYEFLMYECLDDGVTGTWDSTKWQRTTAGEHGGGSDVEITPTLATGTKIADFEIDGVSGELYAPSGGGGASYVELTQAEYNALTPAEKMNGTMYFITDASGGGGGGGSSEIYDDTERVVGTYFGETLYQKTIPNISITGTTNTISTGANIGTLVAVEATGYKIDGGGNIIRFKESYNDGGDTFDVEGINNDIRVICSSWFIGSTIDITIKYTKSST